MVMMVEKVEAVQHWFGNKQALLLVNKLHKLVTALRASYIQ